MVNLRHLIESQLKSANSELEPKRKVGEKDRRKERKRGKARERERKESEGGREIEGVIVASHPVSAEGTRRWVYISDLERKFTGRIGRASCRERV